MWSEFALFFSPRFVSFFWPWRSRGDGTVTVMPGTAKPRDAGSWWWKSGRNRSPSKQRSLNNSEVFGMLWFPLDFLDFPGLGKTSQFHGLGEANVDALSKNGSTPLLVASREGHTPVCKVWNPLNLESPSIHFFFGDQQIAVDGMISHSYKSYHTFCIPSLLCRLNFNHLAFSHQFHESCWR